MSAQDALSRFETAPAPVLRTARLTLEPLRVDHADELAGVLADPGLHAFIGGRPLGVDALRARFARQVGGRSDDGRERWFNWVLRERSRDRAVGQVQATVTLTGQLEVQLAWTVATGSQHRGLAREAAAAMTAWLIAQGARTLVAHIHPDHVASGRVAASLGLLPTDGRLGDEVCWSTTTSPAGDEPTLRVGGLADASGLLGLFDEAVTWLVARGQSGQWGSEPVSARQHGVDMARDLAGGGGLRIAELDRRPVGALVLGAAPGYVIPPTRPELYVRLLLTSRAHAGQAIGVRLLERAVSEARHRDREQIRVDCWARAPGLIAWYERHGFTCHETFEVNGWAGQTLTRAADPA